MEAMAKGYHRGFEYSNRDAMLGQRDSYVGLSGLIVDMFGEYGVVASSAAWVEKLRPAIEEVLKVVVGCKHVVWKSSPEILKEEGLETDSDGAQIQMLSTSENGSNTLEVIGLG
ncbi:hypothetical protein L7F22_030781 [Adiantum nelumboides]|nr:hypothetical protein [Adiantum nelumboides]